MELKNSHKYVIYEISCSCCNNRLYGFKLIRWSLEIEFNEILQDYEALERKKQQDGKMKNFKPNEFLDHMKKNEHMGFRIKLNNLFYPIEKDGVYGTIYKQAIEYLKSQEKDDLINKSKLHYFKQKNKHYIDVDSIINL